MVDVLGHLGMALLWLSPAWLFIDDQRTGLAFLGSAFWFGMLPDVDLVLQGFDGIHHHGVFHTLLFAAAGAALVGPLLGLAMRRLFGGTDWFSQQATDHAIGLGVVGVFVASVAHVFADMLSAPDTSTRIEPLWPLVEGPIVYMDVLYYKSFWATIGLFVAGIVGNLAFWYLAHGRPSRRAMTDTA
ncbi:metal-dependent hydrolase [Halomarina oriensis]|uniref:Metal-dependent hydrolase n=1 Tax=Halomarina oriensis TaxID=671145 RepID=A0A6B0GRD7_9EURY|nr:metal-dependent hydrolase [Halomarina oriensis]MWG36671.1 metal-dependent hydrolase [Halomarina oriensis]